MSLELAVEVARSNSIYKLPKMGAVLVCKEGIAVGLNQRKTHPLQKKFGKNSDSIYLHAEIDAIVNAIRLGYTIEGSKLYVARVFRRTELPALAKPCEGCQRAIIHFGIRSVEWSS